MLLSKSPASFNWRKRLRTRMDNSPAAFRVKVSPKISSGRTILFATNHKTRALIVSVLPEPAPAITTAGSRGALMIAICSGVGSDTFGSTVRRAFAISNGEIIRSPCALLP